MASPFHYYSDDFSTHFQNMYACEFRRPVFDTPYVQRSCIYIHKYLKKREKYIMFERGMVLKLIFKSKYL